MVRGGFGLEEKVERKEEFGRGGDVDGDGDGIGGYIVHEGGLVSDSMISGCNLFVCGSTQSVEGRAGYVEKEGIGMDPGRRRRRSAWR